MTHFCKIVLRLDGDKENFCAFVQCVDSEGNTWEIRAYGKTAGEAADNGWERYKNPEAEWGNFGYIVRRKKQKRSRWYNYDDLGDLG